MSLIRVFQIPPAEKMAKDFLFGGGFPVPFLQVDWFRDDELPLNAENEQQYRKFVRGKEYASFLEIRGIGLLVLGPDYAFTIGYQAP